MDRQAEYPPDRVPEAVELNGSVTAALIRALGDPHRREILRLLHASECMSATQMSGRIRASRKSLGHHVRVLEDCGAVELAAERRVRGATEKFYASAVPDNSRVGGILEDTNAEDEEVRR